MPGNGVDDPQRRTLFVDIAEFLPFAALLGAVGVLAASVPQIIDQATWNSDTTVAMVLSTSQASGAPQGRTTVSEPAYVWVDRLLGALPNHSAAWLAVPAVCTFVLVVLMGATVHRLAGRAAALATAAIVLGGGPAVAMAFFLPQFHGIAWMLTGVAGAGAAFLARSRTRVAVVAVAVAVAVLVGIGTGSDVILAVTGIAPLAGAGAVCAWRGGPRARSVAVRLGATAAGAALVAVATQVAMHLAQYSSGLPGGQQRAVGGVGAIAGRVGLLFKGAADIASGLSLAGVPVIIGAVLAVAVIAGALWGCVTLAMRAAGPGDDAGDTAPESRAWVAYWVLSAVLLAAAFVVSSVAQDAGSSAPADRVIGSERYLGPLLLAAAALLPLWPRRESARALFSAGVTVFVALNLVADVVATHNQVFLPASASTEAQLITVLEQNQLSRGYASYWLSDALTWKTSGRVTVYPVAETSDCGSASKDPGLLCQMRDGSASAWYTPRLGSGQTFVIVDPDVDWVRSSVSLTISRPIASYRAGDAAVEVYYGDIARFFLGTCAGRTDHAC